MLLPLAVLRDRAGITNLEELYMRVPCCQTLVRCFGEQLDGQGRECCHRLLGAAPVLYNPGSVVPSDIQQIAVTSMEYFYLGIPSCGAVRGTLAARAHLPQLQEGGVPR